MYLHIYVKVFTRKIYKVHCTYIYTPLEKSVKRKGPVGPSPRALQVGMSGQEKAASEARGSHSRIMVPENAASEARGSQGSILGEGKAAFDPKGGQGSLFGEEKPSSEARSGLKRDLLMGVTEHCVADFISNQKGRRRGCEMGPNSYLPPFLEAIFFMSFFTSVKLWDCDWLMLNIAQRLRIKQQSQVRSYLAFISTVKSECLAAMS